MTRRLIVAASLLMGALLGGSVADVWGAEIHHGSPTGKYAVGYASSLWGAEFRISADCPASPDRHTGWKRSRWVSYATGNCVFNWTIVRSYAGVRAT